MSEAKAAITIDGLEALISALSARGYEVLGPTVRDDAIVYDEIAGVADLPAGWTDRQDAGRYRLERREDGALRHIGDAGADVSAAPMRRALWSDPRFFDGYRPAARR